MATMREFEVVSYKFKIDNLRNYLGSKFLKIIIIITTVIIMMYIYMARNMWQTKVFFKNSIVNSLLHQYYSHSIYRKYIVISTVYIVSRIEISYYV
jgi:hypothetical protein